MLPASPTSCLPYLILISPPEPTTLALCHGEYSGPTTLLSKPSDKQNASSLIIIPFSTSMTSLRPTLPLLALFRTLLIKTVTSLSLTQSNASLSFIGLLKPATNVLSSWPGLRVNWPPTFNPCGTEMKTLLSLPPTLLSIALSSPFVFNKPMTSLRAWAAPCTERHGLITERNTTLKAKSILAQPSPPALLLPFLVILRLSPLWRPPLQCPIQLGAGLPLYPKRGPPRSHIPMRPRPPSPS